MYKIFAKTILTAYSSLEFMVNQIDILIHKKVASSYECVSAQRQIEDILELMDKKANLINLKLLVDEVLSKMDGADNSVLSGRYIDKIKPQVTIEQLGISRRTFFRKLDKAEESFAKGCIKHGFDQSWLEQNYFDQSWIKDLYERIKQKEQAKQAEKAKKSKA